MESIREAYHRYLRYFLSKDDSTATVHDRFMALAYAVRSEMVDKWIRTQEHYHRRGVRRVYYLSTEYILGKSLRQNIISLGLMDDVRRTAQELGFSLDEVFDREDDLELGNGGKGREAAVMMDALATRGLPGMGYGLRYDYGLFRQRIVNGAQVEVPYDWQNREHPWEIPRTEYQTTVQFGGQSEPKGSPEKTAPHWWRNTQSVIALPSDIPIPGHGVGTVNTLRLWASRAAEEFPNEYSHHGDYVKACEDMSEASRVTRVLHPDSDIRRATPQRLRLQYFLASTALQDILRRYKADHGSVDGFEDRVAIHLAGSSCALAVPELLRLLVDEEEIPWQRAIQITHSVFTYASHALAYDQVEIWPVYLFEQMLPRHLELIYELNQLHLDQCRAKYGTDVGAIREVSAIEEGDVKRVRMGHLAMLMSRGIAAVSRGQRQALLSSVYPRVLDSVGNAPMVIPPGVAHRRWLLGGNEALGRLISSAIGDAWIRDPQKLERLEPLAADAAFVEAYAKARLGARQCLYAMLQRRLGVQLDPGALLDVQVKKVHSCKRQTLHVLGIVARYLALKAGKVPAVPRVHLFGGKAMPADYLGKQTVSLINMVAEAVNADPQARGVMQVVFIPDYGLSWADSVVPATELSEEIGAPHCEACPTTQYKVAFTGAVMVTRRGGVPDELLEMVGEDNQFAFGADGSPATQAPSFTDPSLTIAASQSLRDVFAWLEHQLSSRPGGDAMYPLISSLRDQDRFKVIADFEDYMAAQDRVDATRGNMRAWLGMSIRTVAHAGQFSGDHAAAEYAKLWRVEPSGL